MLAAAQQTISNSVTQKQHDFLKFLTFLWACCFHLSSLTQLHSASGSEGQKTTTPASAHGLLLVPTPSGSSSALHRPLSFALRMLHCGMKGNSIQILVIQSGYSQ